MPSKLINLMSELYSGNESAVRCGDSISDLFPAFTGVHQGCVLAPTLFKTCMDWILGRMSERSSCCASFGNVKISDLDFADDAGIFEKTLDILLGALEVLNEVKHISITVGGRVKISSFSTPNSCNYTI